MAKLFRVVPENDRKSKIFPVRLTIEEFETIRFSAMARNLSVAEFVRRAALGRKADLRYETEIILTLREVIQTIRRMHADLVEKKIRPSEMDDWLPVIKQSIAAILRISK